MHDLGGDRSNSGALRRESASCDGYGQYWQSWPASRLLRRSHATMYVPSARSNRRIISGSSTSRWPSRITFAGSAMDRERTAHPTFQRKGRQVVSHAASGTKAQLVFPVRTRGHDDSEFVNMKLNAGRVSPRRPMQDFLLPERLAHQNRARSNREARENAAGQSSLRRKFGLILR